MNAFVVFERAERIPRSVKARSKFGACVTVYGLHEAFRNRRTALTMKTVRHAECAEDLDSVCAGSALQSSEDGVTSGAELSFQHSR